MPIEENTINDLESAIVEVVEDNTSAWVDKKEQIKSQFSSKGQEALDEFLSWFE